MMDIEDALPAALERLASEVEAGGLSRSAVDRRALQLARRRRLRRTAASGAGAVVVAALLGTLAVSQRHDGDRPVLTQPGPATSTPPAQGPTVVAPTVLPQGFQFTEGGSNSKAQTGGRVTLRSAASRPPVELTWRPLTIRGGCDDLVAGGPAPGNDPRASRTAAIRAYLDGTTNQIGWCERDGPLLVALHGGDLSRQQLADLALTVSPIPGDPSQLNLVPPAGFEAVRDPRVIERSVLLYGPPGGGSVRLRIQVETAIPGALERGRDERGGTLITVGGRPALVGPGGMLLLYDEHTLVFVSGTGLTEQDLRRAAESLEPADAGLAPPVMFDGRGGRCDRLGLCD